MRDTTTGRVFEDIFNSALIANNYAIVERQEYTSLLPRTISGGKHIPDRLVRTVNNDLLIVSNKWQQTQGTAEQKIPYEVIKLVDCLQKTTGLIKRAYIVLGGDGWTPELKRFYVSGELNNFIIGAGLIKIITSDQFLTLANRKQL